MKLPIPVPEPESAAVDMAAIGECGVDYVGVVSDWPRPDEKASLETFSCQPGGQAATAALACRRLGWRTRFVGCVGGDSAAGLALERLRRAGVEMQVVTRHEARTRAAMVLVERSSGARTVLGHREPALRWDVADVDIDRVTDARLVLVDATNLDVSLAAARAARRAGSPVLVDVDGPDPGLPGLLREIDVLVVGVSALSALAGTGQVGEGLRRLGLESSAAVLVATLGADGSLTRCQGREIRTQAPRVDVVDSTGAGDAFRGGLAAGWLCEGRQADLESVLTYANTVAALSCRAPGAQGGLPTHDEVARFL